ncbi:MAG: hypothetical protein GX075_06535 [Firmicutes bacterium]|nr:hypothetical protein [Bacillota bacterium]
MSFGNSIIFPFPAVQYIPLPVATLAQGVLDRLNAKTNAPLIIGADDIQKWRFVLERDFGLKLPEVTTRNSFPLLALNCQVAEVKYRSFYVTMIGKALPNRYHFFEIPRRYFYKHKLFFELYDQTTAQRIARYSLFN